ncbi:MAG: hypothetical protein CV087_05655 [Candidatus Brocadia sp. WS118]|nr:MAG: hypothetical protein CV087_05655 [Candidatus Brocadia sp. WS118]
MIGWVIDSYRHENTIVLWVKTTDGQNRRLVYPFTSTVYVHLDGIPYLNSHRIPFKIVKKKTYFEAKSVLQVSIPSLSQFEYYVHMIERITRHKIALYNADIKPEQMFLYEKDIYPFRLVEFTDRNFCSVTTNKKPVLQTLSLEVLTSFDMGVGFDSPVRRIMFNDVELKGQEHQILSQFSLLFKSVDPDIISLRRGYALIPYLWGRMRKYNIPINFHRWDDAPIEYRGGRSYWSYSQVRYQDYSIHLRGRLLIDTSTFVGSECDLEGIMELVDLSGTLFQPTASRSFGAVFQTALVRLMVREGMIIPFKEKPIEPPLSMFTMLKADRGGLTIDPKLGFHQNVAELDFTSMFPWLIYNHNISVECMLSDEEPLEEIPCLPVKVSRKQKGLIPRALKPFIDRRMYYKEHPSDINKRRAKGLKWVLVSCYGYLRYREFKLGVPTSHMAICAYARKAILDCLHLAEERGFEVIHAIVDSIYITKPNMKREDVEDFYRELEQKIGIPVSFEGVFKWIVFLSSRIDPDRTLPATYFGVFLNGETKVRGLELRQRAVPKIIKVIQEEALKLMRDCPSKESISEKIPYVCEYVRRVLAEISNFKPSLLTSLICISKTEYKHNIPQKVIVDKLAKKGVNLNPGQFIEFIYSTEGPVLPEEYKNNPDKIKYKKLAVRALTVLFEPFGFTRKQIFEYISNEQQGEFNFDVCERITGANGQNLVNEVEYFETIGG